MGSAGCPSSRRHRRLGRHRLQRRRHRIEHGLGLLAESVPVGEKRGVVTASAVCGPSRCQRSGDPSAAAAGRTPRRPLRDRYGQILKPPKRTRWDTRVGCVAANITLMGQLSENPNKTARCEPTASMTARRSSTRCSREGAPEILSDKP